MKSLSFISFLVLVWVNIQAQHTGQAEIKPVKKALGFNLGYQNRQLIDEQKSALTYASGEYLAGFSFRRVATKSLFNVSFSVGTGNFRAKDFRNRWLYSTTYDIHGNASIDSVPVTSGIINGNFQVSYLTMVHAGKTTWLTGASLKEMLVYTGNNIGLLNSLGLYANMCTKKEVGTKSTLYANLTFPLMALNSRLPWHNTVSSPIDSETKTLFKKGTRLVGPVKFRMFQLDIHYDLHVSQRWSLGAGYSFTWMNIPYYQPLKSYLNTIQLQTLYNF